MGKMLIDEAYRVYESAKSGNKVSVEVFNEWAKQYNVKPFGDDMYKDVKDYDSFWFAISLEIFID
jgi:hypothetical protein